jgi:hypothetical protein
MGLGGYISFPTDINCYKHGYPNSNKFSRIAYYDVLKAIAIIAVVLYHCGICKNGYLGVDVFLVIAGFFTHKSCVKYSLTFRGGVFSIY